MMTKKTLSEKLNVAFRFKSNWALRKQNFLFYFLNKKATSIVIAKSVKIFTQKQTKKIIAIIIKKSLLFKQFCGGETIEECKSVINNLSTGGVGTILDYSIEGNEDISNVKNVIKELKETIIESSNNKVKIPFGVFKMTALVGGSTLEKLNEEINKSNSITNLSEELMYEYNCLYNRVDEIFSFAYKHKVKVMVDAEESWFQNIIDYITVDMMKKYNQQDVIVINTYQMYLKDGLARLKDHYNKIQKANAKFGVKIVRGAYMEKENAKFGVKSPICHSLKDTHTNYNDALRFCLSKTKDIYTIIGTHNEESIKIAKELMEVNNIPQDSKKIFFAQLFGMGDVISFNLTFEKYNVAKYVPYGPVEYLIPYLVRRSQENSSSKEMTNRELQMIRTEMKRRSLNLIF